MKFNCTNCGLCCKSLTTEFLKDHKLPEAEWGGCGHLRFDNSCGIYENRPLVCRVEGIYEAGLVENLTKEEWYEENEKACKELQKAEASGDPINTEHFGRTSDGASGTIK